MKLIRFTKTDSKNDVVEYMFEGKVLVRLENPKQGILPDDLIHAIVESKLVVRGLTDLIFAGEVPGISMQADGEAWLSESMVESIQGMLWSGRLDYEQFNIWVKSICALRNISALEISSENFSELEQATEDSIKQWRSLGVNSTLEFAWPR